MEGLPVTLHDGYVVTAEIIHFTTAAGVEGEVPSGFRSDLASVPNTPLLRWAFKKLARHARAAIIHDYLVVREQAGDPVTSGSDVDETFLKYMTADGVSWLRRTAMYWAVCGWRPFR